MQQPGTAAFLGLLRHYLFFPIGRACTVYSNQEKEDGDERSGLEPLDLHISSL
jgi:hypothetical protein